MTTRLLVRKARNGQSKCLDCYLSKLDCQVGLKQSNGVLLVADSLHHPPHFVLDNGS
jgi:hypothetical protein